MTVNGYVRQATANIQTGKTINAADFNAEYNAIATAMDAGVGHTHDGTIGGGQPITALSNAVFTNCTANTPVSSDSSTSLATTAFVKAQTSITASNFTANASQIGGTANAIIVTATNPNTFSLVDGALITLTPPNFNTGSVTINIVGTGALPIFKYGFVGLAQCIIGDIGQYPLLLQYSAAAGGYIGINILLEGTVNAVSSNQSLNIGAGWNYYIATSAISITLPQTTGLTYYWRLWLNAQGGSISLVPNVADNINGGTAGATFIIPKGSWGFLYTDANSHWYLQTTTVGAGISFDANNNIYIPNLGVTNAMLAGSIAASKLVGTDIATVGTITSGTWNGTVISSTYGGTGVNNGSSTITIGGNFTTSGAFTTTLTVTANTNVTLPVSGILCTTVGSTSIVTVGTITSGTWNASVITGQYGGTGVANTGKTITIGGNVTFSGAFTFAGTVTANTTVTFPTSGTLVGSNDTGTVTGTMIASSAALAGNPTTTTQTAGNSTTRIATTAFVNGTALTLATGTTAITQSALDNSTKVATTAYVDSAVAAGGSGVAKAWGSYTVSGGVVTLRKAFNVTSLSRSTAGTYVVTLTNALTDANYAVVVSGTSAVGPQFFESITITDSSHFTMVFQTAGGSNSDAPYFSFVVYD